MSEPAILALIASIPPTIAAIGAIIVTIKGNRKTDIVIKKADEIHTLANSNLTKVTSDLALANTEIGKLRELVTQLIANKS